MTLENGDKIVIDLDNEWKLRVANKDGVEYDEDDNYIYIYLIKFIVANSLVEKVIRELYGENHPIFMTDRLVSLKIKQQKVIINLLRELNTQTFIILREPNKFLESCSDKYIEYYYKELDEKEESPF